MKSFVTGARFSTASRIISSHYHDCHQLLYVTGGGARITVDGESLCIKKNSLVLISRTESHSIDKTEDEYTRYEIRISPEIISHSRRGAVLYSVLSNRPEGFSRVVDIEDDSMLWLFERMTQEFATPEKPYSTDSVNMLLDLIFVEIYRRCPEMFPEETNPAFDMVRQIQQRFESDVSYPYTLDYLAKEYHINKFYMAHVFKRVTGFSCFEYLKALRLAEAKRLLSKTGRDISEIVKNCGFSDSSNFSREFKKSTGLTPGSFRKKYR